MSTLARRVRVVVHSPGTNPRVIFDSRPGAGGGTPPSSTPLIVVSGVGAITAPGSAGFGDGPFGETPFGGEPDFGAISLVYKQIVSGAGAISTGETFATTKSVRREKNVGAVGSLEAFGTTTARPSADAFQLDAFQTDEAAAVIKAHAFQPDAFQSN